MNRAIILCAGDFSSKLMPEKRQGDIVIAADSGYEKAVKAGIQPEIAVGDWDSLGSAPLSCETITLPVRKDDTDLVAAARLAVQRGYREIVVLGALGGKRFSHSLAAVQALGWLAEQGIKAQILDENSRLYSLSSGDSIWFDESEAGSVSAFSLTEKTVLSMKGLWYSGERIELTSHFPLGVSNAFMGISSEICCLEGTAVIVTEHAH